METVLERLLLVAPSKDTRDKEEMERGGEVMLLAKEALSDRIRQRKRGTSKEVVVEDGNSGGEGAKDNVEEKEKVENGCLMKLIQIQVMVRMQLYSIQGDDLVDMDRFNKLYSDAMALSASETDAKVGEGKTKARRYSYVHC